MTLKGFGFDRLNLDNGTHQVNDNGFEFSLAGDCQRDVGSGFTAHQLDVFVKGAVGTDLVIDFDDDVAGSHTRTGRRGIVDGADDANALNVFGNFNPETAEFACRGFLQILVGLVIQKRRVRVKPRNHAFNGVFNELFVGHFIDVIILDTAENLRKQTNVIDRQERFFHGGRTENRQGQ